MASTSRIARVGIWAAAFGYFAAYAPYSALTKVLSKGSVPAFGPKVDGLAILPLSVAASVVGMFLLLTAIGWWPYAGTRKIAGRDVPSPGLWTFLSGLCTAAIVVTTTLAYTFGSVSIVLMMLFMRGGVLAIAPIVDLLSGRKVRWFSWVALGLSAVALSLGSKEGLRGGVTLPALLDIAVYLLAYFVRLRFMSRLAKGTDDENHRYFVEEQMVATPAALLALAGMALIPGWAAGAQIARGFTEIPFGPAAWVVVLIGVLSQFTGVFGGLVLLDKSENTFTVPVNRASSVLAGVVATLALHLWVGSALPARNEWIGAGLIVAAVVVLAVGPRVQASERS